MKVWQIGEHSRAICSTCHNVVTTTFNLHDLTFGNEAGIVKRIIAGSCDDCGLVITIPPQSTPAIMTEIQKTKAP